MNQLNREQLAAVESDARNIVVIAAPGTGKTHVLVDRIARHLIRNPEAKICAITYTIAASKELRERCSDILEVVQGAPGLFIGTIHALALSMLRGPWAKYLPCPEPITVMTQERNKRQIADAVAKVRYKGPRKAVDEEIEAGSWLRAGSGPVDLDRAAEAGLPTAGLIAHVTPTNLVARAYFQACRKASLISYDDLIKVAAQVIDQYVGRLDYDGGPYDELLVDEFQDASPATEDLCRKIPAMSRFFIGDPRQSIFGFLGGSPERMTLIADCQEDEWTRFDLTQSYRCSAPVAAAANRLLSFQNGPKLPEMLAAHNDPGSCVRYWSDSFPTAEDEMKDVAESIERLRERDEPGDPVTIAVLARTNFIVGQFAEYLQSKGIPVVQSDKAGLPEEWETVLALAAVLDAPHNDALAHDFVTLVRGAALADAMRDEAILEEKPMSGKIIGFPKATNAQEAAAAMSEFVVACFTGGNWAADPRIDYLIARALERVGPDATVAELRLALNDPGLRERESEAGSVDVSTIHGYKGREADHVFIVGCNEGILPGRGAEAEEKRLMFVAITRARISCTITCARERLMGSWSKAPEKCAPSRYIAESMGKGSL